MNSTDHQTMMASQLLFRESIGSRSEVNFPPSGVHVPSGPQLRYSIFCHHEVDVSPSSSFSCLSQSPFSHCSLYLNSDIEMKMCMLCPGRCFWLHDFVTIPFSQSGSVVTCPLAASMKLSGVGLGNAWSCTQTEVELFFFFY